MVGQVTADEIWAQIEIVAEPPIAEVQDPDKETTRREKLWKAGALSLETWAGMEGLDYAQERMRGAKPTVVPTITERLTGNAPPTNVKALVESAGTFKQAREAARKAYP
jgi:hypothetical protein